MRNGELLVDYAIPVSNHAAMLAIDVVRVLRIDSQLAVHFDPSNPNASTSVSRTPQPAPSLKSELRFKLTFGIPNMAPSSISTKR